MTRRRRPHQLKLSARPTLPGWSDVPPTSREEVVALLAEMIRAFLARAQGSDGTEAGDE
jgi:hypothetical protein